LILDEATSALDTTTEIKIQHSFDELSKGRTTLVIAHRLSTIKNADMIAVVNDKGIVEQGTHEQLMNKKGEYYTLFSTQAARYLTPVDPDDTVDNKEGRDGFESNVPDPNEALPHNARHT
jgi:ABC-type multidrug transport system ATPase subunit